MSVQARGYLKSMQLHPALDVSGLDPISELGIRTKEDVDALAEKAIAEADRLGHPGRLHMLWQRCLQLGLDERLPSLADANGAVSQTREQMEGRVAAARASSALYLDRSRLDPRIAELSLDNVPLTDWDVASAHNRFAELMATTPPGPARNVLSDMWELFQSQPATSFTGITWELNDDGGGLTYEVDSSADHLNSQDTYSRLGMNREHGSDALGSMYLRSHRYGNDPLMAGITALNADGGGAVETYFDPISQHIANDGMNQGDAANTFVDE